MIGNPKWFNPRKYTGWGLSPNCWQGWAYIAAIAAPIVLINLLPIDGQIKTIIMLIWAAIFAVDFIDIMRKIKRDERDIIHEALAERNAMWFMLTALVVGIAFQTGQSIVSQNQSVDPVIIIALVGAVITKAITNFYLRNK
jgi:UDP-N-acetylmuramyl pentapeptide phosphotransferase/UDP-N-acetylglucosamine-1-phosphate transferase